MVIRNCPNCGGEHWGSTKCPYIEAPCVVCGDMTVMACSDCAIDSGGGFVALIIRTIVFNLAVRRMRQTS